jgi:hypothetical protein
MADQDPGERLFRTRKFGQPAGNVRLLVEEIARADPVVPVRDRQKGPGMKVSP